MWVSYIFDADSDLLSYCPLMLIWDRAGQSRARPGSSGQGFNSREAEVLCRGINGV